MIMQESPLYTRTYELLLWLIPQVQKFPRAYRFGLAERIQRLVLDFQDSLTEAGKAAGTHRAKLLNQADVQLAQLRLWIRMSQDLGLFTVRQYEYAAGLLSEVGKLLGAWLKQFPVKD